MSDKTKIWEALGRTDPAQTKGFTRVGGFKGTAVKPMWCNLRMTEYFGPCGIGWGMDKPSFEVHEAGEEMMVFCTAGLWYMDGDKRGQVYGVGGDKFVTKGKDGSRTSDEAFKAAYTDALGNAMKFIGVAADIHMGLFDDSKYLQEAREAFAGTPKDSAGQPKRITKAQRDGFIDAVKSSGLTEKVKGKLQEFGFESSGEISTEKYDELMAWAKIVNAD